MVMGGASLYEELLPRAERIYLTRVEAEVDGDTWFPQFDTDAWNEVERRIARQTSATNTLTVFLILERNKEDARQSN